MDKKEEILDELNRLYVEMFKLYNQTNPYLGMYADIKGYVHCYEPERICKANAELKKLEETKTKLLNKIRSA